MEEQPINWQKVAEQLRKPEGDWAIEIGNRMNESNAIMNRLLFSYFSLTKDASVLEIGMGNGKFVKELIKGSSIISYTGIDYSKEMVSESIANNQDIIESNKIQFIHSNILELSAEKNQFDLIFTVNTLYFWDSPEETLQHIGQLLKETGSLWIAIRPKHIMLTHPFTEFGFQLYSKEDVIQLAQNNEFKLVNYFENNEEASSSLSGQTIELSSIYFELKKA